MLNVKKVLTILLVTLGVMVNAQNFENSYPFWENSKGYEVIPGENGYTLIGYSGLPDGTNSSLFFVGINLSGDTLWTKTIGFAAPMTYQCFEQDNNGNIYVAVNAVDTIDLIKLSPECDVLWYHQYDPDTYIDKIKLTSDNNLLLAIHPDSGLSKDSEIHKICKADLNGNIIWESPTLSHYVGNYNAPSICELQNDSIAVICAMLDNTDPFSVIHYLTPTGEIISSSILPAYAGTTYAIGNELQTIAFDPVYHNNSRILKFSTDGTIISSVLIDIPDKDAYFEQYIIKSDNTMVAIGTLNNSIPSDSLVVKVILQGLDENSNKTWTSILGTPKNLYAHGFALCPDGGYAVSGEILIGPPDNAPFLIKTNNQGIIDPNGIPESLRFNSVKVYPNPAGNSTNSNIVFETPDANSGIITIIDMYGRVCASIAVNSEKTVWNIDNLKSGVYVYNYAGKFNAGCGKIVITD